MDFLNEKSPGKILVLKAECQTIRDENLGYLDYLRKNITSITHCVLVDDSNISKQIPAVKELLMTYKYYNRALKYNNKLILYPIRINLFIFKDDFTLNVTVIEIAW